MTEHLSPRPADEANWKWTKKAIGDYIDSNYRVVTREDRILGNTMITSAASYDRELAHNSSRKRRLMRSLNKVAIIGTCGVPRGAALFSPLMEDDGTIETSDREETTVEVTRETMGQLALGQLGIWSPHQDEFTFANPAWGGSFIRAGQLATVVQRDLHTLQPRSLQGLGAEYVFGSRTRDLNEYRDTKAIACEALEPGGLFYETWTHKAGDYLVGDEWQPGLYIDEDEALSSTRRNNMDIIAMVASDASHQARSGGEDSHQYGGMGAILAVKKF